MAGFDPLHQLIHSLTKTEKKYFKEFSGGGNYIKLFDAINAQAEYDEGKLLKKLRDEAATKNFPMAKVYVYDAILRALRSYHSGKLMDDVSYEKLQNLKLLSEKGLNAAVDKQLPKLKELCYEYELYPRLLEVLTFEMTLNHGNTKSNIDLFAERLKIMRWMTNTIELNMVYEELLQLALKHENMLTAIQKEKINELLKHPLLQKEMFLESRDERYAFHNVFFVYHYLQQNYRGAYDEKRAQFELYKNNQVFLKTRPKAQLLMLANMVSMAHNIPDVTEFERTYKEMLAAHEMVSGFEDLKFEQRVWQGLLLCKLKGDYSQLEELIRYTEQHITERSGRMNLIRELDIFFNIAIGLFKQKEFSRALDWLNKILNHPRLEERQQVHRYAKILELVLHFELNNFTLIDYKVVNTYRYLYKRQKLEHFDRAVLTGMKAVLKSSDKYSRKDSLQKLSVALKEIPKEEYEKIANDQFDYVAWINEKMK